MNLTRCSRGHFYDSDKYSTCPHCQNSSGIADDVKTKPLAPDDVKTVPISMANISEVGATQSLSKADDDQKTISYSSQTMGTEPVVGWLVITRGADLGLDFKLKTGRNFIGRSSAMDVSLKNDKTVSREKHGIVVYDPKSCTYLVQPGESKELCYLNNEVVLTPQKLNLNDVISVGETDLMFVPFCSKDGFNWDKSND